MGKGRPNPLEMWQRALSSRSVLRCTSWNLEVGNQQFEQLCDRFAKNYPSFIAEPRKKHRHYLAFLSEQALAFGLGNYTLRELLGCMLSSAAHYTESVSQC
jgi:hypothetical protein